MKSLALPTAFVLLGFTAATSAQETAPVEPLTDDGAVPIFDLIDQVAEDMDQDFVLDQRLSGVHAMTTNDNLDYEGLLGILRINAFVAVEMGDQIFIVPEQNARAMPTRVLQEDDSRVSDHEVVTRTIVIPDLVEVIENDDGDLVERNILQATMLVPILRPLMEQSAMLGAVPNANILVLVDRYDNVRRITRLVEEIIDGLDD